MAKMTQIAWECKTCNTVSAVTETETKGPWEYMAETSIEHAELNPLCGDPQIYPLGRINGPAEITEAEKQ